MLSCFQGFSSHAFRSQKFWSWLLWGILILTVPLTSVSAQSSDRGIVKAGVDKNGNNLKVEFGVLTEQEKTKGYRYEVYCKPPVGAQDPTPKACDGLKVTLSEQIRGTYIIRCQYRLPLWVKNDDNTYSLDNSKVVTGVGNCSNGQDLLGAYLSLLYQYAASIIGVLVVAVVVVAGLMISLGGLSEELVSKAKSMMVAGVGSLVLLFLMPSILIFINQGFFGQRSADTVSYSVGGQVFDIPEIETLRQRLEGLTVGNQNGWNYINDQITTGDYTKIKELENKGKALVFALIAQESSGCHFGRPSRGCNDTSANLRASGVGAFGLMQLTCYPYVEKSIEDGSITDDGPEDRNCSPGNLISFYRQYRFSFGSEVTNPKTNIDLGLWYLDQALARVLETGNNPVSGRVPSKNTDDHIKQALAYYNGGSGAVKPSNESCPDQNKLSYECENNPGFQETRDYVSTITANITKYETYLSTNTN